MRGGKGKYDFDVPTLETCSIDPVTKITQTTICPEDSENKKKVASGVQLAKQVLADLPPPNPEIMKRVAELENLDKGTQPVGNVTQKAGRRGRRKKTRRKRRGAGFVGDAWKSTKVGLSALLWKIQSTPSIVHVLASALTAATMALIMYGVFHTSGAAWVGGKVATIAPGVPGMMWGALVSSFHTVLGAVGEYSPGFQTMLEQSLPCNYTERLLPKALTFLGVAMTATPLAPGAPIAVAAGTAAQEFNKCSERDNANMTYLFLMATYMMTTIPLLAKLIIKAAKEGAGAACRKTYQAIYKAYFDLIYKNIQMSPKEREDQAREEKERMVKVGDIVLGDDATHQKIIAESHRLQDLKSPPGGWPTSKEAKEKLLREILEADHNDLQQELLKNRREQEKLRGVRIEDRQSSAAPRGGNGKLDLLVQSESELIAKMDDAKEALTVAVAATLIDDPDNKAVAKQIFTASRALQADPPQTPTPPADDDGDVFYDASEEQHKGGRRRRKRRATKKRKKRKKRKKHKKHNKTHKKHRKTRKKHRKTRKKHHKKR